MLSTLINRNGVVAITELIYFHCCFTLFSPNLYQERQLFEAFNKSSESMESLKNDAIPFYLTLSAPLPFPTSSARNSWEKSREKTNRREVLDAAKLIIFSVDTNNITNTVVSNSKKSFELVENFQEINNVFENSSDTTTVPTATQIDNALVYEKSRPSIWTHLTRNFPQLLFSYSSTHNEEAFFPDEDRAEEDADLFANWESEKKINDDFENNEINGDECDKSCLEIRSKLSSALENRDKEVLDNEFIMDKLLIDDEMENYEFSITENIANLTTGFDSFDDDQPLNIKILGDSRNIKNKKMKFTKKRKGKFLKCFLETFIPLGNCTNHGVEETWGHEKLCTACRGIYLLNRECFPAFLNSVICDKNYQECIFDKATGIAHGKCQTKTLSFKVMRNRGDDECEEWIFEYLDVPVACECYLSKNSWLESIPSRH